jgi:hypothetical protein
MNDLKAHHCDTRLDLPHKDEHVAGVFSRNLVVEDQVIDYKAIHVPA